MKVVWEKQFPLKRTTSTCVWLVYRSQVYAFNVQLKVSVLYVFF